MDAAAAALRISAHKSHKTSPWDDDLVERLKLLWADGVSASAIALEFGRGITRNAIIGKVHRLGFTNRVERRANSMPRPARPQKFKPLRREFSDWKPFIAPAISDLDIPLGQRKSFIELAPGDCRWGVGDVGSPGFFFCGAPQAPGLPYCHAHRARVQRQGARLSSPRFHLQALPLANLARGCRMIFRSEEDFDRTLDEFAKARRAWPLYLARSVRLRSPVIGNLAGRRSKENPAAQRRRRGSRPSSTALRRRWIEFGCCSSAGLFSSWW
jgi:GcrA cell cycle regulator